MTINFFIQTYLNPDGFLGGLNLNRENTTLRPDYENILRFYGFDLSIDLSNFTADNTGNFGLRGSSTTNMPTMISQTQMATTPLPGSTMMPNDGAGAAAAGQTLAPTTLPPAMNGGMAGEFNLLFISLRCNTTCFRVQQAQRCKLPPRHQLVRRL